MSQQENEPVKYLTQEELENKLTMLSIKLSQLKRRFLEHESRRDIHVRS